MGLALFKEARPSADISPNDLTNSKLVPVEEAVVSSDSVVDYKPSEQPTKDDLFTGLARSRRGTRLIEREVANLDKFGRSEKEKLQVDPRESTERCSGLDQGGFPTVRECTSERNRRIERMPDRSLAPMASSNRGASARRSRCGSRT